MRSAEKDETHDGAERNWKCDSADAIEFESDLGMAAEGESGAGDGFAEGEKDEEHLVVEMNRPVPTSQFGSAD
jgi:hypothetical protein